jgi:hypothetical protein
MSNLDYKCLNFENAQKIFTNYYTHKNSFDLVERFESLSTGGFKDQSTEEALHESLYELNDHVVQWEYVNPEVAKGGKFDAYLAKEFYSGAKNHITYAMARDPDFWRWITWCENGIGAKIIENRHGRKQKSNFGIARGSLVEFYLARIYLQAYSVRDRSNQVDLKLVSYPDTDLWRSHVLRPRFGKSQEFARAFVELVMKQKLPSGDTKNPDVIAGYRDLASELTARRSSQIYELMSQAEASEFIKRVWNSRDEWASKSNKETK